MIKLRNLEIEKVSAIINFLKVNNIENGQILRQKISKKDNKKYFVMYFEYLDIYIVNNEIFTNQLKAINYFNKL